MRRVWWSVLAVLSWTAFNVVGYICDPRWKMALFLWSMGVFMPLAVFCVFRALGLDKPFGKEKP